MKSINTQVMIYIILDLFVLAFSVFKGYTWIVNTQIAFLSAFSIVLLSFLSYVKNINKQIKTVGDIIDDKDFIDELDDPYELYEDDKKEDKDNKKSKVKISMKNLAKSKGAAFSIFRILGYMVLIGGFFLLLKMKSFQILPYIIGISIIPVGGLINIIYQRKLDRD